MQGKAINWADMQYKKHTRTRTFQRSGWVYLRLLIRFWFPLFLIIGYFTGMYFWSVDVTTQAEKLGRAVVYSEQRSVAVQALTYHVQNMVLTDVAATVSATPQLRLNCAIHTEHKKKKHVSVVPVILNFSE